MKLKMFFSTMTILLGTAATANAECVVINNPGGGTTTRCSNVNNQTTNVSSSQIQALYVNILGRQPDSSGASYWLSQLSQGVPLSTVRGSIAYSSESQNNIRHLYLSLLGREPDSGGFHHYLAYLANGGSLEAVRHSFLNSAEYLSRR